MRGGHGGGGPVAPLGAAMLAEGDVEALVNKRLVGVVVVGQQRLLELALVHEGSLGKKKNRPKLNVHARTDEHRGVCAGF